MNSDLNKLQPYPFEKLSALKAGLVPPAELEHIALSIGEPKHSPPALVLQALANNLDRLASYPATKGLVELRQAIATWAEARFQLPAGSLDPECHLLPVNGTREALFAIAQAVVDRHQSNPRVVCPNPFYQIYEGAALLAGAQPTFLNCTAEQNYIPDFAAQDPSVWRDCQLLYICSPGNPTGAVLKLEHWRELLELADRHNFVIASDECYSELYQNEQEPPMGLLQACHQLGRPDFSRCLVFHSLSKRSNLPGLRSGFVAGDAELIRDFLKYRTYHGCALPVPTQLASIAAWQDETHVRINREHYREKFSAVLEILRDVLPVTQPKAGFYLWPQTPIDGESFAQALYARQNVTVLPGSYLTRVVEGVDPGVDRVRMALVAPLAECIDAAQRIRRFVESL
ncbi:succinyldiaminopimelate transaminase [Marinimicrobium sp. ABcell2]|uniref:succinyldiaminopimelate transaminase n=1 Tax=Marinimicrobium sp. ABcell2 TaxID=3069751 RepID=UPI0027B3C179|nr:succinyldiaminopimelate transaminase [Marinimicrobium sp. ABcell2]MDQ2075320.1 succinyldiaminopimelate transaminase [Marinimicrobium sp. ABcell2]